MGANPASYFLAQVDLDSRLSWRIADKCVEAFRLKKCLLKNINIFAFCSYANF